MCYVLFESFKDDAVVFKINRWIHLTGGMDLGMGPLMYRPWCRPQEGLDVRAMMSSTAAVEQVPSQQHGLLAPRLSAPRLDTGAVGPLLFVFIGLLVVGRSRGMC